MSMHTWQVVVASCVLRATGVLQLGLQLPHRQGVTAASAGREAQEGCSWRSGRRACRQRVVIEDSDDDDFVDEVGILGSRFGAA